MMQSIHGIYIATVMSTLCLNAVKPDMCNRTPTKHEQQFIAATTAAYYLQKHEAICYDMQEVENGNISGATFGPYYQKAALNHIIQQLGHQYDTCHNLSAYYTHMGGDNIVKHYARRGRILRITRKPHSATAYIHEAAQQILGEHYLEISCRAASEKFSPHNAVDTLCQRQPYIEDGYIDTLIAEIHHKMRFMNKQ